jgi:hypothetical protein
MIYRIVITFLMILASSTAIGCGENIASSKLGTVNLSFVQTDQVIGNNMPVIQKASREIVSLLISKNIEGFKKYYDNSKFNEDALYHEDSKAFREELVSSLMTNNTATVYVELLGESERRSVYDLYIIYGDYSMIDVSKIIGTENAWMKQYAATMIMVEDSKLEILEPFFYEETEGPNPTLEL